MVKIGGDSYHLIYNGAAQFEIREKYGPEAFRTIQEPHAQGVECLRDVALVLSEQGELYRQYQGYPPGKTLTRPVLEAVADPLALLRLRVDVLGQVVRDMRREVDSGEEDVDLGLLELQKKQGGGLTRPHFLRLGLVAGLTARETMLLPVGLVYDLWELHCRAHMPPED